MNVAIYDYGTGNLHSLAKAFERAGAHVKIETEPAVALQFEALVLPGAGSYGAASSKLALFAPSLRAALASGHPCLGINLGMHLLFEASDEGEGAGLAVFRGRVGKVNGRRVPHVGWNDVEVSDADPLFGNDRSVLAYFANTYVAEPLDDTRVLAWAQHEGDRMPAVVRRDYTWGVQFHPEKSGAAGLQLIHNFLAATRLKAQ